MSCDGLQALNPVCQLQAGAATVANSALTSTADAFGQAALSATTWLWEQIDSATSVDLGSAVIVSELGVTGAIAGVLCLGLFLVQLITALLRREPGALGRGLRGLLVSGVGTAFALAVIRTLIGAVDALASGVVEHTLGTNVRGIGAKLSFSNLAAIQSPAITLILSLVLLASVVLVWAAMMVRKMMLIVMAVLAPIAFAGAAADITKSWVRRWVEFVVAMVASKLLLILIMCIGVTITTDADGSAGASQGATQLAIGTLLLLLGGLSPWVAIRMCHFAGESLHTIHSTAGQATAGARAAISAPQKVAAIQAQGRAAVATLGAPRMAASRPASSIAGGGSSVNPPQGLSTPRPSDPSRGEVTTPAVGTTSPTPPSSLPGSAQGRSAAVGSTTTARSTTSQGAEPCSGATRPTPPPRVQRPYGRPRRSVHD